ncbi:MAG: hypothetical protein Q7S98_06100, partial [Deltaproteobacteria bacterium]|nr:hypothetical protein [Deltaproteobacteria bacterium]
MEPYTWGSSTYDLVSSEINFKTGAAGGSSTVTMVAAPTNSTICGNFVDEDGKGISPAVNYLYVYGTKGTLWRTATVNDKGDGYCLKVSRGTWTIGFWVDWNSTYASMPPGMSSHKIEVPSASKVTQDLTFLKTGYIQVKVTDPDGNPVKWAWVVAGPHSAADIGSTDTQRYYYSNGCSTDSTGECKITVPASCKEEGTKLYVNVYKPFYELNNDGWTNPEEETVTVTCTKTATAPTLAFVELDGEMEVTASTASDSVSSLSAFGTLEAKPSPVFNALSALNQDVVSSAYVSCFSDLGRYTEGTTDATGSLKLKCVSGDLWHCFGVNQLKNNLYISEAADVVCSPTEVATQAVTLKLSDAGTIPDSTSESWDSATAHTLKLADGFSLYAPSGSLAKSGTISCKVQPKAQIAYQAANRPANKYGYDVTCTDANGAAISKFNSSVTLCLPISKEQRDVLGLKNSDLKSAYFDEKTGTYANLTNVTVSDDKVCSLTDHFTTFAITGNGNLTGVDGDTEGAIDEQHRTGEAGTDGGGCGCRVVRSPVDGMINAWWFFLIVTLATAKRLCRKRSS